MLIVVFVLVQKEMVHFDFTWKFCSVLLLLEWHKASGKSSLRKLG